MSSRKQMIGKSRQGAENRFTFSLDQPALRNLRRIVSGLDALVPGIGNRFRVVWWKTPGPYRAYEIPNPARALFCPLPPALVAFIKCLRNQAPNKRRSESPPQNGINFERDKIDGVVIQTAKDDRIETLRTEMAPRIPRVKDLADGKYRRQLYIRSGRLEKDATIHGKRNRDRQEPDGGIRRGPSEASAKAPRPKKKTKRKLTRRRRILFGNNAALEAIPLSNLENSKYSFSRAQSSKQISKKTGGISRSQIDRHNRRHRSHYFFASKPLPVK